MSVTDDDKAPIIIINKKIEEEHSHHSTAWKIALADFMTTLMILFFVLWIVSITPPNKKKAIVSFFKGKYDPSSVISAGNDKSKAKDNDLSGRLYLSLSSELSEFKKNIHINLSKGRVELNLNAKVLFKSGSSDVSDDFKPIIERVVKSIQGKSIYIDVYGYTDNIPIKKSHHIKNNLILSVKRAESIANELVKFGVPIKDIGIHGEGARFPVAKNNTAEGRSKNRRIIIYMSPKRSDAHMNLFEGQN